MSSRTAGPGGRVSREIGQGLTAAAISVEVRAEGRLAVLGDTVSLRLEIHLATTSSTSGSRAKASKGAEAPAPAAGAPAAYQVLARRYRSRSFDELVGQEAIARTLRNAIATGRTAHAYLFCGTRGVGKTSMARIFARALNATESLSEQEAVASAILRGEDIDVIEIDGASNRGVDDARDLIAGAGIAPTRSPYKIYIIDEVHMLTQPAFNALLKTMEEPPANVKFILCTTEPHKVPATIQSRCQRFDFHSIPSSRIAAHLSDVLAKEGITADDSVVAQVARLANGSMRDGLSLMDRLVSAAQGHVSAELAREVLGLPDDELLDALVESIASGLPQNALAAGAALLERGMSPDHALETLAARLRDSMMLLVCGAETELVDVAPETRSRLRTAVGSFDVPGLVHLITLCDATSRTIRNSSIPRALFDAALVRLALAEHFANAAGLLSGTRGALPRAPDPKA